MLTRRVGGQYMKSISSVRGSWQSISSRTSGGKADSSGNGDKFAPPHSWYWKPWAGVLVLGAGGGPRKPEELESR